MQSEPDADLLHQLTILRKTARGLGIRMLIPEERNADQNLLIDLMSCGFYDFWFLTALNAALIDEIIRTKRDFRAMEAYLAVLPAPAVAVQPALGLHNRIAKLLHVPTDLEKTIGKWLDAGQKRWDILGEASVKAKRIGRSSIKARKEEPVLCDQAADKCAPQTDALSISTSQTGALSAGTLSTGALSTGDTALFFSEEDCLLPYALAVLSARHLASGGAKTLLVELPGSGSRLAVTLGLRHPGRNLHSALRDYAAGGQGDWRGYCFNGPELYHDHGAIDHAAYCKRLPQMLYFLPDDHIEEKMYPHWDGFLVSLIHWALMEERFSNILYVGFGSPDSLCWKKGLVCSHKIIAFPPWPSGFNSVPDLERHWQKGSLPAFDGSWGMGYIHKEAKSLRLKNYLIVPGAVKDDFISMVAFERSGSDISPESLQCLHTLWDRLKKG